MSAPAPVFWPFPVLPPEQQTAQHLREIDFLEAAHRDGFHPCKFADGEYRIESPNGRSAWIIYRGRLRGGAATRWEVWLNDGTERVSSVMVEGFEPSAEAGLRWVRGDTTAVLLNSTVADAPDDVRLRQIAHLRVKLDAR